ncbi:serine/threonine-protein kinase [Streptomyces sp. NPDC048383]|uniref:serine/threonine-protein kinase n=1 Tax=Streptomyces sp. NPDC048383 TaxID=3155386 RepID=UPI003424B11D
MSGNESDDAARVVAGRYRLLGPLGRGGMGIVWRARDEVLGREVAVKEVRAPAGTDAAGMARMYRRLEREAWAAARVSHRGVVTVYDVPNEDGRPWIVMELVRGLSLAEVLEAEGPMSPQRAAHLGEQVLAALRAAHEAGVLHRDVKPANVLIANDGRVVLGDFGIASLEGSSAITMTGEVIGSPEFLAPERALGRDPGPESDLWSLGVLLYAAVEGVSPFRQDTPLSTLRAVVDGELPPPRRAGALEPVLEGLLRKDPERRLDPAEATRMLRVIGAGGAARASGGPVSGPGAAATTVRLRQEGGGPYGADTPAMPVPVREPGPGAASRQGNAGTVLVLGVVVLLVALGVLVWLLFEDPPGGDGKGAGASVPSAAAPDSASASASPSPSASASASASVSAGTAAAQVVTVHVHTLRAAYSGSCPPPAVGAPAFTATLEVARTPAELEYRWATRSGVPTGQGWVSLAYEEGGPRTRQLLHTELAHRAGAVLADAVRLEVRQPVRTDSAWLDFSVTCAAPTPTGTPPSPSPSGSPTPSTSGSADPTPSGAPGPELTS